MSSVAMRAIRVRKPVLLGLVSVVALSTAWSAAEAATLPTLAVESASTSVGQTVPITITLSDAPLGVAGYDFTLTLSKANVASIVGADLPAFGLTSQTLVSSAEIRLRAADVAGLIGSGATDVLLATVMVQGLKKGTTELLLNLQRLEDDAGYSVGAQVLSGKLRVTRGSGSGGGKGGGGKGNGKGPKK